MKANMSRIWEVCKGIEADETLLARLYKRNIPVTLGPSGLPDAGGRKFSGVYVREDFKRTAVRYIRAIVGRRAECETETFDAGNIDTLAAYRRGVEMVG